MGRSSGFTACVCALSLMMGTLLVGCGEKPGEPIPGTGTDPGTGTNPGTDTGTDPGNDARAGQSRQARLPQSRRHRESRGGPQDRR